MKSEMYTNVLKHVKEAHEELVATGQPLTYILNRRLGKIVSHAQASINRGLLAEALYLASTGKHDPQEVITERWDEMVKTIAESNTARHLLASFFNMGVRGIDEASVLVLPIGESRVFTSFNDLASLEKALRGEPELVSGLIAQGRNRLSIGALTQAASLVTDEQLEMYRGLLARFASKKKDTDEWIVKVGTKGVKYNQFALAGYEAIKAAKEGREVKAGPLRKGMAAIVPYLVDTAVTHQGVIDSGALENDRFMVNGRFDDPVQGYYAGAADVEVRFAHFEFRVQKGNNSAEALADFISLARDSWHKVATEWMQAAHDIHNALAETEAPLEYRLRSGLMTDDLELVISASRTANAEYREKKDAEFMAKLGNGHITRDRKEHWDAATDGVLNAVQKAQLNKLRKTMGYANLEA